MADEHFIDALLAAPAGVALLARLEADQRNDVGWFRSPTEVDPAALRRAVAAIETMSFGHLLSAALMAVTRPAGAWMPDAPADIARAYRCANGRRVLAEALVERFGEDLHGHGANDAHQLWLSYDEHPAWFTRPLFTNFDEVYGNGEFTSRGLFTVTEPANEIHVDLLDAWEMDVGASVSRWHLPVAPTARVWNLHRPADWVALVAAYPKVATAAHGGWELPGPNQHLDEIDVLLQVPGQNAARIVVDRHVLPDWRAVATDYDGVHLSWAGLLTMEGNVSDLPDGGVTMLRYWFSERTLWLADVFGQPMPLGAPSLPAEPRGTVGVDAAHDSARRGRDLQVIRAQLAR